MFLVCERSRVRRGSRNPTALVERSGNKSATPTKKLKFTVNDFFEKKTDRVGSNELNGQLQWRAVQQRFVS